MKKSTRRLKRILALGLTLVMLMGMVPGTFSVSADTEYKQLSQIGAGELITMGGSEWIVLDPSTGYVMEKYSAGGYRLLFNDSSCLVLKDGGVQERFIELDTYFKNRYYDAYNHAIPYQWGFGYKDNESGIIFTKRLGFLSYSEYNQYRSLIAPHTGNTFFWTRTRHSDRENWFATANPRVVNHPLLGPIMQDPLNWNTHMCYYDVFLTTHLSPRCLFYSNQLAGLGTLVTSASTPGGNVTASPRAAMPGATISVTAQADKGKRLVPDTLQYQATGSDGVAQAPVAITNGVFTLPSCDSVAVSAVFEDDPVTVTYKSVTTDSPDTEVVVGSERVLRNFTATAPVPVRSGYQLTGWTIEGTTTLWDFAQPVPEDTTLLAKWALLYPVTVIPGLTGGTLDINRTEAIQGAAVQVTPIPAKGKKVVPGTLHYTITRADGTESDPIAITGSTFTMPEGKITLGVTFVDDPVAVTYKSLTDESPAIPVIIKTHNLLRGYPTAAPTISRADFQLTGWFNLPSATKWDFEQPIMADALDLTAKWAPVFSVTQDAAVTGGTVKADPIRGVENTAVEVTVNPDKDMRYVKDSLHYTYTTADGTTTVPLTAGNARFLMPSQNVTLSAAFEKDLVTVEYESVTDDSATPVIVKTETLLRNRNTTAPTVSRANHQLVGWFEEVSTSAWNFTQPVVKDATKLIAKWTPIFTANSDATLTGGTLSAEPSRGIEGTAVNVTVTPDTDMRIIPGTLQCTFVPAGGIKPVPLPMTGNGFLMPAGDVTVSAQFEKDMVNVAYMSSTESSAAPVLVKTDSILRNRLTTAPTGLTLKGYRFTGWYAVENGVPGSTWDFKQPVQKDSTVLLAKWIPVYSSIADKAIAGGRVSMVPADAVKGTVVKLVIVPSAGNRIKAGSLKYKVDLASVKPILGVDQVLPANVSAADTSTIPVEPDVWHPITGDSFIMPDGMVTVSAEFESIPVPAVGSGSSERDRASAPTATGKPVINLPSEVIPLGAVKFYEPYVLGYPDATFHPTDSITRAQLASMLVRILKLDTQTPGTQRFNDVSSEYWAFSSIQAAAGAGIFNGYADGSFKPEKPMTRGEMAAAFEKYWEYLKVTTDSKPAPFTDIQGNWAEKAINKAYNGGVVNGFEGNLFKPEDVTKREQAVVMINKLIARPLLNREKATFTDVTTGHWAYSNVEAATSPEAKTQ